MGTSTYVYLGPFLRVPNVVKHEPATPAGCSRQCGATVPEGSRFCPSCGARAQGPQPARERSVRPRPYDLGDGDADELFWIPEYIDGGNNATLWLPNVRGVGQVIDTEGNSVTQSLRNFDASALQARYVGEWSRVVALIEERLGVKAEVDVGIVVYSH